MKNNLYKKNIAVGLIVLLIAAGCSKKQQTVDINSATFQIQQSENLIIPAEIALPANLPNGNTLVASFYARGVQQYKARVVYGSNPERYEWVLTGPSADLYNVADYKVGIHGTGPYWKLISGDSILAEANNPPRVVASSDPKSIDWLLLRTKIATIPTGFFANVDYVQRIATNGGKAPANPPLSIAETASVKYTAVYRFSKKNL